MTGPIPQQLSSQATPFRGRTARRWVAFLLVALGLFGGKALLDYRHERTVIRWFTAASQYWAEGMETRNRVYPRLVPLEGGSPTQIESRLGLTGLAGQLPKTGNWKLELPSTSGLGPDVVGWRLTVLMREGAAEAFLLAPPPPPPPPDPRPVLLAEQAVRLAQWLAPLGWIGMLIAGRLRPRHRPLLVQLSLAAAIVATLAWASAAGFPHAGDFLALGVGTLMILTSGSIWLRGGRRMPFEAAALLCPACDYDLTGNESGVCPECGEAVAATAHAPVEQKPSRPRRPAVPPQFVGVDGEEEPTVNTVGGPRGLFGIGSGPIEVGTGSVWIAPAGAGAWIGDVE